MRKEHGYNLNLFVIAIVIILIGLLLPNITGNVISETQECVTGDFMCEGSLIQVCKGGEWKPERECEFGCFDTGTYVDCYYPETSGENTTTGEETVSEVDGQTSGVEDLPESTEEEVLVDDPPELPSFFNEFEEDYSEPEIIPAERLEFEEIVHVETKNRKKIDLGGVITVISFIDEGEKKFVISLEDYGLPFKVPLDVVGVDIDRVRHEVDDEIVGLDFVSGQKSVGSASLGFSDKYGVKVPRLSFEMMAFEADNVLSLEKSKVVIKPAFTKDVKGAYETVTKWTLILVLLLVALLCEFVYGYEKGFWGEK